MLFEVTLGIKFTLIDVRPLKNNGVTQGERGSQNRWAAIETVLW